jgi:anaerobic selenocysteine-containing dehydrogenase
VERACYVRSPRAAPSRRTRTGGTDCELLNGKVNLHVPELLGELALLATEPAPAPDPAFPFVLSAGERRSFTANTVYRDPAWRKKDAAGALRMNASDAVELGLTDGGVARVTTRRVCRHPVAQA